MVVRSGNANDKSRLSRVRSFLTPPTYNTENDQETKLHRLISKSIFSGLLLALISVLAQASEITGTAKDSQGAFVPGAKVVLTDATTQAKLSTVTDKEGKYAFESVSPGVYIIEVDAKGFKLGTVSKITVAEGGSVSEDFVLELAPHAETVTVESQRAGVDNYVVTNNVTGAKAELPITDIAQDIVIISQS
jgi:hypothetical protein